MNQELIPNLFRTEYQKIVSVLCHLFGIHHIEIAEDIVSDTFLAASETWAIKGIPENPTAWLYTVAKNKTKNYFKRNAVFEKKIVPKSNTIRRFIIRKSTLTYLIRILQIVNWR